MAVIDVEAEDFVLANSGSYIRMRNEALAAYANGRTIPLDSLT